MFMHGVHRTEMIMLADLNADWQLKPAALVAQVDLPRFRGVLSVWDQTI